MNTPEISGYIRYVHNGKSETVQFIAGAVEATGEARPVHVAPRFEERDGTLRLTVDLLIEAPVQVRDINLYADLIAHCDDAVLLNGYQSWTDTAEYGRNDKLRKPQALLYPLLARHRLSRYGDYEFSGSRQQRGMLHGVSWGHVRSVKEDRVRFFGSLDERSGFTFFYAQPAQRSLRISKDARGLNLKPGLWRALDIFLCEGLPHEVMERWFNRLGLKPRPAIPASGWTSWYNYYRNIDEDIILHNLAAFERNAVPADFFQIDDGWQKAVGDWLEVKPGFPAGMKALADRIRGAGYQPGLWLAPFAVETDSTLFRDHPDWLVTDARGRPFSTGGNWSGFYALDIYNPQVREHIRRIFNVILNEWGYDLVKLDFLYGACILPRPDKTRGQIMCDAMEFLRDCVGEKKIIGCGVPLWPAFGTVEYCRIGTDIDLHWHDPVIAPLVHREYPSTRFSLQNTVWRHTLDGRAFINDPDVFLLRSDNIKLSQAQKRTVFFINAVFGNLLFTSDDITLYDEQARRLFLSLFPHRHKHISGFRRDGQLYTAWFSCGNFDYILYSNHGGERRTIRLEDGLWFRSWPEEKSAAPRWLAGGEPLEMGSFATECLLSCRPQVSGSILGSSCSAFPGSEVDSVSLSGSTVNLSIHRAVRLEGSILISAAGMPPILDFRGKKLRVQKTETMSGTVEYITINV